jgi:hypothetical protein
VRERVEEVRRWWRVGFGVRVGVNKERTEKPANGNELWGKSGEISKLARHGVGHALDGWRVDAYNNT